MTITRDDEGKFCDKVPGPDMESFFYESDLLPEGAALLERAVSLKAEITKWVNKVQTIKDAYPDVDLGIEIGHMEGTFTEDILSAIKGKIEEK